MWHETLAALPTVQRDASSASIQKPNLEQLRNEADSLLAKEAAAFERRLGKPKICILQQAGPRLK